MYLQVVTCSGVGDGGSLRIVRNGIGMIEQATVELPGVRALPGHRHGADFRAENAAGCCRMHVKYAQQQLWLQQTSISKPAACTSTTHRTMQRCIGQRLGKRLQCVPAGIKDIWGLKASSVDAYDTCLHTS